MNFICFFLFINLFFEAITQECNPSCVYGICNDGECLCMQGYTGNDCDRKIPKDYSLNYLFVAIIFVSFAAFGSGVGYGIFYLVIGLKSEDEVKEESIEKWEEKRVSSEEE